MNTLNTNTMKKLTFLAVITAFSAFSTFAQKNMSLHLREMGVNMGYSCYLGDLQPKKFTHSQVGGSFGLNFRQYFSDRISAKAFLNYARIQASDYKSGDYELYYYRNLSFRNEIKEVGFQAEIALFRYDKTNPYNDDKRKYHNFTPYAFVGFNGYYSNPKAFYKDKWVELQPLTTENVEYSKFGMAIPFGLGFKYQYKSNIAVSLEFGMRKTFSDYLDDVSDKYPDMIALLADKNQLAVDLSWRADEKNTNPKLYLPTEGTRRGDASNKDWYLLTQFSIQYCIGK